MNPAVLPGWWEEFPGRLEAEVAAFRDLGLEFVVDEAERARGRIVLAGNFRLKLGREIPLRVVYPDTYPRTRFVVFAPQRRDRVSAHQNPIGTNLCLLPRGSIYWDPAMLAARVIADRLELIYSPDGVPAELEEAQGEPVTSYLPALPNGGIVVAESCFSIPEAVKQGRLRVALDDVAWLRVSTPNVRAAIGKGLLVEVRDSAGATVATADDAIRAPFSGQTIGGVWERLATVPDARNIEDLDERLRALLAKAPPKSWTAVGEDRFLFGALLVLEEGQQRRMNPTWVFQFVRQKMRTNRVEGPFPVRTLRYGKATRAARVPELAALGEKVVSVIGLGSLGAPLALGLARAGVAQLRIADFDHVEPAGGVRWVSDLDGAGAEKTAALRAIVARNFPLTRIQTFDLAVGRATLDHQEPSESSLLSSWSDRASLLVDATAEDDVSRVVSAYGDRLRIPQLYLWSYEAFGGVVVRVVPGKTGCFHCAQLHLSVDHGTIKDLPFAEASDRQRVQPVGCADATFTGEAASLTPLADQASRVAFGILCSGAPGGYPSYQDDLFVLKLREPDGTLVTPRWTSHPLTIHQQCTLCNR